LATNPARGVCGHGGAGRVNPTRFARPLRNATGMLREGLRTVTSSRERRVHVRGEAGAVVTARRACRTINGLFEGLLAESFGGAA